jgi:uncharacterized YccA/Bax inhibitor family protein
MFGNQKSSNPIFGDKLFNQSTIVGEEKMTVNGALNKTFMLSLLVFAGASISWNNFFEGQEINGLIMGGAIGGLIFALITIFKREWAPITAPIYAFLEGLFLGGISAYFNVQFPGITLQAVALTFGVLLSMIFIYKNNIITVNDKFRGIMMMAMGSIFLVYMISWIMGFFGGTIPYIHEGGLIGIGFSLVIVVVAGLSILLDLDFIYKGAAQGLSKKTEWYAAFGLMVTLVWLYIEILRLLSKLRD